MWQLDQIVEYIDSSVQAENYASEPPVNMFLHFLFFLKLYLRICFKTQMPTKEHSMKSTGPGLLTGSPCHLIN